MNKVDSTSLMNVAQRGRNAMEKGASSQQSLTGEITMAINTNKDKNIPPDTEACYETLASQEEIYLEETEEEVRAILTSDDQSPSQTTAEYWQSKIEELELDWKVERSYDQCKR
jgi:hypothetical protein